MDPHQMESSSSLHSKEQQHQNRQAFREEPANMAKSVSYSCVFSSQLHSWSSFEQ
jgi:hypothetical protein